MHLTPPAPAASRLARDLLAAYCSGHRAVVTAVLDRVTARLAAGPARAKDHAAAVVSATVAYTTQVLHEDAKAQHRDPYGAWNLLAPPGHHWQNEPAYNAAEGVLNAALNRGDHQDLIRAWLLNGDHRTAVALIAETAWIATMVHADHARTA